jgi:fibro-slime domain-containing protein
MLLMLAAAATVQADTVTLAGTVRDFKRGDIAGGHPDFETFLSGVFTGIVETTLGGDMKPVYASPQSAFSPTTGATNFNQWYNNTAGVNLSTPLSITLDDTGSPGIFKYTNFSFFPIDGMLFGNEGFGHNFHFTFELHTQFTYQAGQVFDFTGDDDVWVFINNALVIDLGGVHGPSSASVNLDTLGLTAGNTYPFDFFFAERHTSGSDLVISTSIVLQQPGEAVPEPASSTLLILGGIGLSSYGWRRWRKG